MNIDKGPAGTDGFSRLQHVGFITLRNRASRGAAPDDKPANGQEIPGAVGDERMVEKDEIVNSIVVQVELDNAEGSADVNRSVDDLGVSGLAGKESSGDGTSGQDVCLYAPFHFDFQV